MVVIEVVGGQWRVGLIWEYNLKSQRSNLRLYWTFLVSQNSKLKIKNIGQPSKHQYKKVVTS